MMFISALEEAFTSAKNSQIAAPMAAYMKNKFSFLGIKKPERAVLQKKIFNAYPLDSEESLCKLMLLLWDAPEREYHYAACDLAYRYKKLWSPKMLLVFEELIRRNSWWDTVDTLAAKLVGTLLTMYPELTGEMNRWIEDENLWIRRAALLFQLSYKKDTDEERLFAYCAKTAHEKDFFMRKAIGWVLRQHSKTRPQAVQQFILEHKKDLSALSIREGSKYLPN